MDGRRVTLDEPLLTVAEVARLLGLSPRTLYAWVERDEIPHLHVGRAVRFERAAIIRFLEESDR
jgi:excisionase family DNA binding protein